MEARTHLPDAALPQGSPGLHPSTGPSQVNAEECFLIRGNALQGGELRYACLKCRTSYNRRAGYFLHVRSVHNPRQCFLCDFRWGRPYEYRRHLRKTHPHVNRNLILGKPKRSHRRATILTELLPQQPPVSPPAIEQDQQNSAESQPNSSSRPAPAPAEDISVSPPVVSSWEYDSQAVDAEQTVAMDESEYAHGSEFLYAIYFAAMLLSIVEHAEPMNDFGIDTGQFGLPAPSGSTATLCPSSTQSPPMPNSPPSNADIVLADSNSIDAAYPFTMLPSTVEHAKPMNESNDLDTSLQDTGQFGLPTHLSVSTDTLDPSSPESTSMPDSLSDADIVRAIFDSFFIGID